MAVVPPSSVIMLQTVARWVTGRLGHAGAGELEDAVEAALDRVAADEPQDQVLGGDPGRQPPLQVDADHDRGRGLEGVAGHGQGDLQPAGADGDRPAGARGRGVRVGSRAGSPRGGRTARCGPGGRCRCRPGSSGGRSGPRSPGGTGGRRRCGGRTGACCGRRTARPGRPGPGPAPGPRTPCRPSCRWRPGAGSGRSAGRSPRRPPAARDEVLLEDLCRSWSRACSDPSPRPSRATGRRSVARRTGSSRTLASRSRKSALGRSRAPRLARWGVTIWTSIRRPPASTRRATRSTRATLEASVARWNMDSPVNTPAHPDPYRPPTRPPSAHTSRLWAWPRSCRRR
jgi:hypothetical protein